MIEVILDEIKAIMITNLPTQITRIDDEMGDRIFLDNIADRDIHVTEKQTIKGYPSMIIVPNETPVEDVVSGQKNLNHGIFIAVAVTDTNEERLSRKLFRYLEIVRRIIELNDTLNNKVSQISVVSKSYSPMLSSGKQFYKDFVVKCIAVERETYEWEV